MSGKSPEIIFLRRLLISYFHLANQHVNTELGVDDLKF